MDSGADMILNSIKRKVQIIKDGLDEYGLDFTKEIGVLDTLTRKGYYEKVMFDKLNELINLIEKEPDNQEVAEEILRFIDGN